MLPVEVTSDDGRVVDPLHRVDSFNGTDQESLSSRDDSSLKAKKAAGPDVGAVLISASRYNRNSTSLSPRSPDVEGNQERSERNIRGVSSPAAVHLPHTCLHVSSSLKSHATQQRSLLPTPASNSSPLQTLGEETQSVNHPSSSADSSATLPALIPSLDGSPRTFTSVSATGSVGSIPTGMLMKPDTKRFAGIFNDYTAWIQMKEAELAAEKATTATETEDDQRGSGGSGPQFYGSGNVKLDEKVPGLVADEEITDEGEFADVTVAEKKRDDGGITGAEEGVAVDGGGKKLVEEARTFSQRFNIAQIWGDLAEYYDMDVVEEI